MEFTSHSAVETEALAETLGRALFPGAFLALWGGLGAGKTAFVRGLARGMGVHGRVTSPTFALIHEHAGDPPLYHFDLYRLTEGGLMDIDAEEYFSGTGVCAVEWPENAGDTLPRERLDVRIAAELGDTRRITLEARGEQYETLLKGLEQ